MEEVPDVYARPYNPDHPVICLDESPKQLISESRTSFTDSKGITYTDYEYKREGTVDLYMVAEPSGGRREVPVKDKHTRLDQADVVAYMAEEMYPSAEKITLIQDNLSAHKKSVFFRYYFDYGAWSNLKVSSSLNDQTRSVRPAAMPGVLGAHLCTNNCSFISAFSLRLI